MVDVNLSGPLFDGRAELAVTQYIEAAEDRVAEHGVNVVRTQLNSSIRVNTGRYVSRVHSDRAYGDARIWDGGVVYGPWLEGTGSRNRTTRFKGYRSYRLATPRIQAQASGIAQTVLPPYLGRMS